MRFVKAHSSIPVPTVYAHAGQVTTPGLGTGYIVMEYMPGYEVDPDDDDPDIKTTEDEFQVY
jgi:aminoglycoside phosphotransferase (APT) family kinase protein